MISLQGKVAVVTGAASGIGRELALACAREGASVVLADVDEGGNEATAAMVAPLGGTALAARCDVSRFEEVDRLARLTYERFGACHLVFNNAGVAATGPAWSATAEDWEWVLGINLMGVVHGIRAFVPRMLGQGGEGHVVNTASVAGFLSLPGSAVYCVSKHAVVTLSECLQHDLRAAGSRIGVSLLCPAFVPTGIAESQRNRPPALAATNPLNAAYEEAMRQAVRAGKLSAGEVARLTIEAVKANRFYVLPHARIKAAIETRLQDILHERAPTDVSRPVSPAPGRQTAP